MVCWYQSSYLALLMVVLGSQLFCLVTSSSFVDLKDSNFTNYKFSCLKDGYQGFYGYYDAEDPLQLQNYTFVLVYLNQFTRKSIEDRCKIVNATVLCRINKRNSWVISIRAKPHGAGQPLETKKEYWAGFSSTICKCKSTSPPAMDVLMNDRRNYRYQVKWTKVSHVDYNLYVGNDTSGIDWTRINDKCSVGTCYSDPIHVHPCVKGMYCLYYEDKSCQGEKLKKCGDFFYPKFVNTIMKNLSCLVINSIANINFSNPISHLHRFNVSIMKNNSTLLLTNISTSTSLSLPLDLSSVSNKNFLSATISPCFQCNVCLHPTSVKCIIIPDTKNSNITNYTTANTLPTRKGNPHDTPYYILDLKTIVSITAAVVFFIACILVIGMCYHRKARSRTNVTSEPDNLAKGDIFPRPDDDLHVYEEIRDFHHYTTPGAVEEQEKVKEKKSIDTFENEYIESSSEGSVSDAYV